MTEAWIRLQAAWPALKGISAEALQTFEFANPQWLWLLPLIILLWWRRTRHGPRAAVQYSSLSLLQEVSRVTRARRGPWPLLLRTLALTLITLALAAPRIEKDRDEQKTGGIDLILVLDMSRSMDSKDFDYAGKKVSRRDALQTVIGGFIKSRPRDRIGVIGFAEKPFLISPLTLDHSWMLEALSEVQTSLGTAIGSAVQAAVDLLRDTQGANRTAIVVTDGLNTSGIDPLESARIAQRFGVRLYTIGVVSYDEMRTSGLDEVTLNRMARMTGGQFFQAANGTSLETIYREIDQLERKEFKQARLRAYRSLFVWFAVPAFVCVMLELLLFQGRGMRLP